MLDNKLFYSYEGNFNGLVKLDGLNCSLVEYAQQIRSSLVKARTCSPRDYQLEVALESAAKIGWDLIEMSEHIKCA